MLMESNEDTAALETELRFRIGEAELAFDQGNREAALVVYGSVIADHRYGAEREHYVCELAKCHLNVAAILLSLGQWRHSAQRCRVLLDQYNDSLDDLQRIKICYFESISFAKMDDIKRARSAIDELYRLVRGSTEPLSSDEADSYREAEQMIARKELARTAAMFAKLVALCEACEYKDALRLLDSVDREIGRVPSVYALYFQVGRAGLSASLGYLDKVSISIIQN